VILPGLADFAGVTLCEGLTVGGGIDWPVKGHALRNKATLSNEGKLLLDIDLQM
jgi:hypothetical protein